jgi:3-(3-hydroxy-phenyl)propionate hydroxylase
MKGDNYEGRYVIADIRMDHDFPTERRAFFEPSGNPGGTVLIHKQPENIWRVDYQLREGESEQEALREENIRARVGAILRDINHSKLWELEWWSIYSANTLCLDDYRHGRVFLSAMPRISCRSLAYAASTTALRCRKPRLEAGRCLNGRSG